MNKRVISIVAAALLLIGGSVGFLLVNQKESNMSEQPARTETAERPASPAPAPEAAQKQEVSATTPGAYVDYKEGVIANTKGTKLLFFHAPWCPQCRDLEASIKAGGVPENVSIIKVDYDSNQALRQKYGVTIQTTVVRVDDAGNLIKKFVAYKQPTLAAVRQELL